MDSNHRLPGYEPGALTSELSCDNQSAYILIINHNINLLYVCNYLTYSEFESEPRLSIYLISFRLSRANLYTNRSTTILL